MSHVLELQAVPQTHWTPCGDAEEVAAVENQPSLELLCSDFAAAEDDKPYRTARARAL